MTTIPVERKKIESWLTGLQCGVISQRHVFEELRALLAEQPQAGAVRVYACPRCGTGMEVDGGAKPPARHDQGDEVRRLREALITARPYVADALASNGANMRNEAWRRLDLIDAALTHSPKGEEE